MGATLLFMSIVDTDCRSLRSLEGASPFNPCFGRSGSIGRHGQLRAHRRTARQPALRCRRPPSGGGDMYQRQTYVRRFDRCPIVARTPIVARHARSKGRAFSTFTACRDVRPSSVPPGSTDGACGVARTRLFPSRRTKEHRGPGSKDGRTPPSENPTLSLSEDLRGSPPLDTDDGLGWTWCGLSLAFNPSS
jgi:hypothetical protein